MASTPENLWDSLWVDARLACMTPGGPAYGAVEGGALGIEGGMITYAGPAAELPGDPESLAHEVRSVAGAWITPGLIDCHTHLVYGGDRSAEFEQRLEGASYEEIARAGGGILSTVRGTRSATPDELLAAAAGRLAELAVEGVTTIEIKSGYGLDTETEVRMLEVARELGEAAPVDVTTTFLGAHALPPEYAGRDDAYVDLVVEEMLPTVAERGLADAVDAFCEGIAFSVEQVARVFDRAAELGLPVKLHAEQLSDLGGAQLLARHGGLSADHLEYVSEAGVEALAEAGSVAVLLPGAFYTLRETQVPPIESFRRHDVPIALATDSNPGSSPVTSLLLMLNMGCTLFRLTPEEALTGVTRNAARALGLTDTHGTLEAGKAADFVVWDIERPAVLSYAIGANPCRTVVKDGRVVLDR